MIDDSVPPHSASCEESAICCALMNAGAADIVVSSLKEDDFYSEHLKSLYVFIRSERYAGREPDFVTAPAALVKCGIEDNELGANLYILSIQEREWHHGRVDGYCVQVKERSQRRAATNTFRIGLEKIKSNVSTTTEIIADAIQSLEESVSSGISNTPQSASDVLMDVMLNKDHAFIPTGIESLDAMIDGLSIQSMTILGARPSVGKTALAISVIIRMAKAGHRVFFSSLEMPKRMIGQRLATSHLGIPFRSVRDGNLTPEERDALIEMQRSDWMERIMIDDEVRDVESLSGVVRLAAQRHGVRVLVVDYLQMIPPANPKQPREQQVSEISRKLKALAKRSGVAILCLSQLNREIDKRDPPRPRSSDLRESGSIEQDADGVLLLWRPNKGSDSADDFGEVIIDKVRNGSTGSVKIAWSGPTMTYGDIGTERQAELSDRFD